MQKAPCSPIKISLLREKKKKDIFTALETQIRKSCQISTCLLIGGWVWELLSHHTWTLKVDMGFWKDCGISWKRTALCARCLLRETTANYGISYGKARRKMGEHWEKYLMCFSVLPLSFRHPLSADVGKRTGFLTNLVQLLFDLIFSKRQKQPTCL